MGFIVAVVRTTYKSNPVGKVPANKVLIRHGPSLPVIVGKPTAPPSQTEAAEINPDDKNISALVDTGATDSCVDNKLAQDLSLQAIDRCFVGGVAGKQEHLVYLGKLVVPDVGIYTVGRLIGVDLGSGQPVILGRDFLSNTIMIYDGLAGDVTFAR